MFYYSIAGIVFTEEFPTVAEALDAAQNRRDLLIFMQDAEVNVIQSGTNEIFYTT